ncbi:hypothetical protein ABH931_006412 [Streptacidiphilus sp. MAP12-33]
MGYPRTGTAFSPDAPVRGIPLARTGDNRVGTVTWDARSTLASKPLLAALTCINMVTTWGGMRHVAQAAYRTALEAGTVVALRTGSLIFREEPFRIMNA